MPQYKQFYKASRFLRANLSFEHPVVIRRVVIKEANDGDCCLRNDKFFVRIERNIPEYYAIEILIHELAHALAWDKDKNDVHGRHWGIAYSKVYRLYLRFLEEWQASN